MIDFCENGTREGKENFQAIKLEMHDVRVKME